MSTIECSPSISRAVSERGPSAGCDELTLTRDGCGDSSRRQWQELIDYKLIEWGRDPGQFEDDGITPPSGKTIELAIRVAEVLRENGAAPPVRVVPDAHGGIVFERKAAEWFESFRVCPEGRVEYRAFENCRMVADKQWLT